LWCLIPIWAADQLGNKSLQGKIITTKHCIMTYLKNIFRPQKFTKPIRFKSLIYLSILIALFTVNSCSDDGDNFTPSASDILVTIDENPSNGTTIGTVATNLTGTLNYTITSQSVPGAFSINATSGVVTISDGSLFDYETTTILTAQVEVTNSSDTAASVVEVTLNDIDDIAFFLSTSRATYEAANDGDWVFITGNEYFNLADQLNNVAKSALSDENFDQTTTAPFGPEATAANVNGPTIPTSSYVFAARFKIHSDASDSIIKIKVSSSSVTSGYMDIGNPFTENYSAGTYYVVLKGSNSLITGNSYLALYESTGRIAGVTGQAEQNIIYGNGDTNDLTTTITNAMMYQQCLSSTQKQWD